MVLYFSGTGNSQFVAEEIAKVTNDELISINQLLKQNNFPCLDCKQKPLVFVAPTYAWRIPRVVDEFIRKVSFSSQKDAYFILTCGSETSNAIHYVEKLCNDTGLTLGGFAEVVMPDNYITLSPSFDAKAAKETVQNALPTIQTIANNIAQDKPFELYSKPKLVGKLESSVVNPMFYSLFVTAKGFYSTEKCISCKKCAQLCPLNNISFSSKLPSWGEKCTHCMACICGCPTQAIEFKNKTQNKARYFFQKDWA